MLQVGLQRSARQLPQLGRTDAAVKALVRERDHAARAGAGGPVRQAGRNALT